MESTKLNVKKDHIRLIVRDLIIMTQIFCQFHGSQIIENTVFDTEPCLMLFKNDLADIVPIPNGKNQFSFKIMRIIYLKKKKKKSYPPLTALCFFYIAFSIRNGPIAAEKTGKYFDSVDHM